MRRALALALLAAGFAGCASRPAAVEMAPAERAIGDATLAWVKAFESGDPVRVAGLYASDAVLWGITMKQAATTHVEILAYFKTVATNPKNKVILGEQHIRVYGDTGINTGTYTFDNVQPDGKVVPLPARFSFVFHFQNGRWRIVDHHSSRLP